MICVPLGATWPIATTWRCCRRARPTNAAGESSRQEGLREASGRRVGRSPRVANGAVERSGSGDWSRQAFTPRAKGGGPEGCRAKPFLLMASDAFRSVDAVSVFGALRFGTPKPWGSESTLERPPTGDAARPTISLGQRERSPKGMDKFAVGFNLRSSKKGGAPLHEATSPIHDGPAPSRCRPRLVPPA